MTGRLLRIYKKKKTLLLFQMDTEEYLCKMCKSIYMSRYAHVYIFSFCIFLT